MTNLRLNAAVRRELLGLLAPLSILAGQFLGSDFCARAQSLPLPTPLTTITTIPAPAADAFSTALRYGTNGRLYAWDGTAVWQQNSVGSAGFTQIGTINSAGADAGPINFSQDNSTIIVSNGFGGMDFSGASNGLLFTIPAAGGAANSSIGGVASNSDLTPIPSVSKLSNSSTSFYVNSGVGSFGSGSVVSVFDSKFATDSNPENVPVITGIPGASTSLAFNAQTGKLYVGVGSGPDQGEIRAFAITAPATDPTNPNNLDHAYSASSPLDFLSQGTLINPPDPNNSGLGMFFDARGFLFAGGPNGLEVLDPTTGHTGFYSTGLNTYAVTLYNPFNDELALYTEGDGFDPNPFPNPMIFNASQFAVVPEPASVALALLGGGLLLAYRRNRKRVIKDATRSSRS